MYKRNTDKLPKDSELRLSNTKRDENSNYTWECKIDVATKYMALGNFRLVSEVTKVPYRTLMFWRKEPWWAELIEEIKKTRQTELNTKLSKIVDKSLEVIADRLENGDFVLNNKTGELIRKPVTIKEANVVTKDLLNHQIKMEQMVSNIEIQKETVADQLKILAGEFAKWSRQLTKRNASDINYKEITNALHDQRVDSGREDEVVPEGLEGEEPGKGEGSEASTFFQRGGV